MVTALAVAGSAAAKKQRSPSLQRTLMLKAKFTGVGRGELLGGNGRYVVINRAGKVVLIDSSTGRHRTLSEPGCSRADAIGGPLVVLTCGQGTGLSYALYDLSTGQTRSLAVNPSLGPPGCAAACLTVTAVGSDWISFAPQCPMEHCEKMFEFQNLATGETATDPTGPRTAVDLSSESLGRAVCAPVTVPQTNIGSEGYLAGWGSVTFDGRFAIATSDGGSYLEQCGSRLHEFLTFTSYPGCAHAACAPPSNSHMIVWESKPLQLSGIFLPSRRRFKLAFPTPTSVPVPGTYVNGNKYGLVLTQHTLYVSSNGYVFKASIPTAPPRAKHSCPKH